MIKRKQRSRDTQVAYALVMLSALALGTAAHMSSVRPKVAEPRAA